MYDVMELVVLEFLIVAFRLLKQLSDQGISHLFVPN